MSDSADLRARPYHCSKMLINMTSIYFISVKLLGHLVELFLNLNRMHGLVFCEIHSKIWDKTIKNRILVAHDLILDGVFLVFHHMDTSAQVHAPPCNIVQHHRKIMSRKSTKDMAESGGSNTFRLASALPQQPRQWSWVSSAD